MELETINKLYLELSQIATATTKREIDLGIKIDGLTASVKKWKGCFDKVHNLVCDGNDLTPYEVIQRVRVLYETRSRHGE